VSRKDPPSIRLPRDRLHRLVLVDEYPPRSASPKRGVRTGELRLRIGKFLPIEDSWGFTRMVRQHSGLPKFHPHQMRHTFACRWLERGGS